MLFNNNRTVNYNSTDDISPEASNLIMEAAILESFSQDEIQAFLENEANVAVNEEAVMEKTIIRLDKKAKISQARKVAIFTIAKEKNDPKFKKLLTVWRMERKLEAELDRKYGNEATRRAKTAVNSRKRSKSPMIRKAATNAVKSLNGGVPTNKVPSKLN